MKIPCDICKFKCKDEIKEHCIKNDWVDFEPENEDFCVRCNAYKAFECRLIDGNHCLMFIPIVFTLAVVNDGEKEIRDTLKEMKGV